MSTEASASSRRKLRPKVVEAMRKFHLHFRKIEDQDDKPGPSVVYIGDRTMAKRIRHDHVESRKRARRVEPLEEREDYTQVLKVKPGDVVLVSRPGGKRDMGLVRSREDRPQVSPNHAHRYVHVHWMIQSTAYGKENEWFLKDGCCESVPLRDVYQITACKYRPPQERQQSGETRVNDQEPFWKFRLSETPLVIQSPETMTRCDSCRTNRIKLQETHARPLNIDIVGYSPTTRQTGVCFRGFELHIKDIVLFDSCRAGFASEVAQIVQLPHLTTSVPSKEVEIQVRMCERTKKDEPQVTLTKIRQTFSLARVTHKCRIAEGGVINVTDLDVVVLNGPFHRYRVCTQRFQPELPIPKVPSMDLYAGGGGTLLGAQRYFEPVMAVDCDPAACATLRRNFPDLDVREAKLHDLHDAELSRTSTYGPRILPKRGEIFLLTACPPCQGHTGINRFKSNTDWRVNEVYVTMSEVDRLRPDVFLLENVPGMLSQREDNTFAPTDENGIGRGSFAQAAMYVLVSLGCQCRLAVLDSRSYGSPQNRQRVFILASRHGVPLPTFPHPSHANPRIRSTTVFTRKLDQGTADQKYYIGYGTPGAGPYSAVTVQDAISDLPAFEYRLPGSQSAAIPTFTPSRDGAPLATTKVGFFAPVKYAKDPVSRYQAVKRGESCRVLYHYTPARNDGELKCIVDAFKYADLEGNSSRLDPNEGFMTLLTNSGPGRKVTRPIHYSQRRTLSIAERKRGQGVPDGYILEGTVLEQDSQIGNMVDVSMGEAIYAAIHRQIVIPRYEQLGRPADFATSWRA